MLAISATLVPRTQTPSTSSRSIQSHEILLFPQSSGADDKPRPFYNLRNTCFINASLTTLFGPKPCRQVLSQIFHNDEERLRTQLWPVAVSRTGTRRVSHVASFTHEERLAVTYATSLRPSTEHDPIPRGNATIP